MEDLQSWRAARRAELLSARLAISATARRHGTEAMHTHLRAALPAVHGLTITYYVPFKGEPDLRPLFDEWRAAGAATALPVVVGPAQPLEFRLFWPGAPLVKGPFSLPMPQGTPQVVPQIVLMPPVGFDERGYRLGYGAGYFDRTLATMTPMPLKIGVAFEVTRMVSICPQSHDIAMDYIVSEAGLYRVRDTGLERLPAGTQIDPLHPRLASRSSGADDHR
jgi:5-formyltetrahydrofolate cyclo-ligase